MAEVYQYTIATPNLIDVYNTESSIYKYMYVIYFVSKKLANRRNRRSTKNCNGCQNTYRPRTHILYSYFSKRVLIEKCLRFRLKFNQIFELFNILIGDENQEVLKMIIHFIGIKTHNLPTFNFYIDSQMR